MAIVAKRQAMAPRPVVGLWTGEGMPDAGLRNDLERHSSRAHLLLEGGETRRRHQRIVGAVEHRNLRLHLASKRPVVTVEHAREADDGA